MLRKIAGITPSKRKERAENLGAFFAFLAPWRFHHICIFCEFSFFAFCAAGFFIALV